MKILLDTHILIWFLQGNGALSPATRQIIIDAEEIYYSIISIFEIELKHAVRPEKMPDITEKILKLCEKSDFIQLPLEIPHILELKNLKRREDAPPHKDPFDKLLLCQAIAENMIFMTHDKLIAGYVSPSVCKV